MTGAMPSFSAAAKFIRWVGSTSRMTTAVTPADLPAVTAAAKIFSAWLKGAVPKNFSSASAVPRAQSPSRVTEKFC
jgi:hypothetical protein